MTDKRCLIYETLGKVSDLEIVESKGSNGMRLHGVFGVCGIKNQNNRVYDKENYKQMVESLQKVIKESGCPGELEHPNSMNINLQNVSHKIESIQMNEDGTITGDILLLNTPSGKIAQAIVEGGLPLYISSRGAGTITNEGRVTLSTIKTYDLVGTPGFSQAKLTLKENQKLECLNEGLEEGNNETWVIVEGEDDLLSDDDDKNKDKEPKDEPKEDDKPKDEPKEDNKDKDESKDKDKDKEDNKNNGNDNTDMEKLREAVEELTKKVESLEAELHVAKESLEETKESVKPVNYETIEQWVKEEFAPEFKQEVSNEINESVDEKIDAKVNESMETIATGVENWINEEYNPEVQKWVNEEFAPMVQQWIVEEFAPEVQNWVVEEFAPEVQNWVVEEFSPEVQNWVVEEFSPEIQGWITEEFAPVVEGWITEEFAPEQSQAIENKVNENVSAFMESQKAGRLEEIDGLLESIANDDNASVNKIVEEEGKNNKYKGVYVVENMPAEYRPSWELLTEARQQEIIRSSRMYDFMKEGQIEKFWANVDFNQQNPVYVNEAKENPMEAYQNSIVAKMKALRRTF